MPTFTVTLGSWHKWRYDPLARGPLHQLLVHLPHHRRGADRAGVERVHVLAVYAAADLRRPPQRLPDQGLGPPGGSLLRQRKAGQAGGDRRNRQQEREAPRPLPIAPHRLPSAPAATRDPWAS